jgi:hypothetical protein
MKLFFPVSNGKKVKQKAAKQSERKSLRDYGGSGEKVFPLHSSNHLIALIMQRLMPV